MAKDTTAPADTAVTDAIDALLHEEDAGAVATEPEAEGESKTEPDSDDAAHIESENIEHAELQDRAAAEDSEHAALAEEAIHYYGLSKEEVEEYGDLLPKILARMDQQASLFTQPGHKEEGAEDRTTEPDPKREPEKKTEPLADLEEFDLPLNREEYDEPTLKVFDALKTEINKHRSNSNQHKEAVQMIAQFAVDTNKTVTDLRNELAELKSERQTSVATDYATEMDDFFANLPEEYADIYGKEPMSALNSKSPTVVAKVAARHALEKEMNDYREIDKKANRPARATKAQAARTLRALHADEAHQIARREVNDDLKKFGKRGIAKPTGRSNKKSDTPAARHSNALAAIAKHMPSLGL